MTRGAIVRRISVSARTGSGGTVYAETAARRKRAERDPGPPVEHQPSQPGQPPRRRIGKLVQSIFGYHQRAGLFGAVGTKVKYGVFLELGAKRGPVVPKRKKALAFGLGGQWVVVRRVKGATILARPYIWDTVKKMKSRISATIFKHVKTEMAKGGVTGKPGTTRFGA